MMSNQTWKGTGKLQRHYIYLPHPQPVISCHFICNSSSIKSCVEQKKRSQDQKIDRTMNNINNRKCFKKHVLKLPRTD